MSFFGRLVPILWRSAETEATVAAAPPLVLYGAFLLHTMLGSVTPRCCAKPSRLTSRRSIGSWKT